MPDNAGDFMSGQTVRFPFATSDASGAKKALVGGAATVYRDGSDTGITAGVTVTPTVAGQVGRNRITIDTANVENFPKGSSYEVVLTAGTVDDVPLLGEPIGVFSIENSPAAKYGAQIMAAINAGQILGTVSDTVPTQGGFIVSGPAADRMISDNCYAGQFLIFSNPADPNQGIPVKISGNTAITKRISVSTLPYAVTNGRPFSIQGKAATS